MKTILLTGGAGYIGSHTLLELAQEKKYSLVVFDNLQNGNKEAIEIIQKETGQKIELIKGDLLNKQDLEKLFSSFKFDAVIHFAALIEAGKSMTHPTRFLENNITGSLNLFMAMQKHNVRKIVFSSTAAVYGTPKGKTVTEDADISIENWYAFTKITVEEMLRAFAAEDTVAEEKIDSVILRYFNAAGTDPKMRIGQDYPNPTHLMTLAIETALGIREKLFINGNDYPTPDGTCIRDYIHVVDLARAHVKALEYLFDFEGSDVFNLGTGKGTSVLEVVESLKKIHGKFNWDFGPRRAGDPASYFANPSKANKVLGWKSTYTYKDALKHAYEWKKKYPQGFEDKIKEYAGR